MATASQSPPFSPAPRAPKLHRIADQIRLQIRLAGMEAKDAWRRIEPRLHEYEQKLESTRDKVTDEVHQLGESLEEELAKLLDRLKH